MLNRPRRPVTQWHTLAPCFPPELEPERSSGGALGTYYANLVLPTSFQDKNYFATLGTNIRHMCAEGISPEREEESDDLDLAGVAGAEMVPSGSKGRSRVPSSGDPPKTEKKLSIVEE
jgi:hypothetical protein